jgi:diguanylate cyclase (GGDEF)-like protein
MSQDTDEERRLAHLRRYQILDTPPDRAFDRITAMAARLFQVPIALVSLVDRDRIWFKSRHGLDVNQVDRELGLCASAILHTGIYEVTDAATDPRTLTNAVVHSDLGLRFYAAAPLHTHDGYNLGALCIMDQAPRSLSPEERATLEDLAAVVMDELELRLAARRSVSSMKKINLKFQALLKNMPGMVYRYLPPTNGAPHRFTFVSHHCQDLLELPPAQLRANADNLLRLMHPEDVDSFITSVAQAVHDFTPWTWEGRIVTPSGQLKWLQGNSQAQDTPEGKVWDGLLLDISDRKHGEIEKLRRQAAREQLLGQITQRIRQTLDLGAIINTTVAEVRGILQVDRVLIYRLASNGMGVTIAEDVAPHCPSILGQTYAKTVFPRQSYDAYIQGKVLSISDVDHSSLRPCLVEFSHAIGIQAKLVVPIVESLHPPEESLTQASTQAGTLAQSTLWGLLIAHHGQAHAWQPEDIELLRQLSAQMAIAIQQSQLYAQVQRANRYLTHLATHDGLTQVANRRQFDTYLQQEWMRLTREQAPLSVILCDIDYFKLYNDTYGHLMGDQCLQQVAQALQQVVRRPADLVARYGGEEFAIVLPRTDQNGAQQLAQAINGKLHALNITHQASPISDTLTISLGIASAMPTANQSPQGLISRADQALYRAKQQGRDRYCLQP